MDPSKYPTTHKDKWLIKELLSMCVQEERMLKMELGESALMATEEKDQNQAKKKGKGKILLQGGIKKANRCFFYKKKRAHEEGLH